MFFSAMLSCLPPLHADYLALPLLPLPSRADAAALLPGLPISPPADAMMPACRAIFLPY